MHTWKNTYKYKMILALLAQSNLYWHISYTDYLGVFGGPHITLGRYFRILMKNYETFLHSKQKINGSI